MGYSSCYTRTDLDVGHKLKLVSKTKLKCLQDKYCLGDVFEIINIDCKTYSYTLNNALGNLVIDSGQLSDFLWKY